MPEQKADECEAPEILLCRNCDEPVTEDKHHLRDDESWSCIEPNWRERAKKAEAELTAAYDEIFWTVPEAAPLVEKIKTMHGMETDALLRAADFEKKYNDAQAEVTKLKQFEYSSFQQVASEVMARLEKSGYGKKGEANTFWAMVHAACDEVDRLREMVKQEDVPELRPVNPKIGLHMTWKDFMQYIDGGDFTDDDGQASLATATHVSDICIECSQVRYLKKPEWATHVIWYNR